MTKSNTSDSAPIGAENGSTTPKEREEQQSAAQGRPVKPKRTSWGVKLGSTGIFVGTPRLLDITWGRRVRWTVRTYNHVLILSLRHLPRIEWSRW